MEEPMDITGRFAEKGIIIKGTQFTRPRGSPIHKLGDLPKLVQRVVRSKEDKPTHFRSFVVTVINKDTDEEFQVYMPHYVAKYADTGERFIYAGMQKKSNGNTYHDVMWEKKEFV